MCTALARAEIDGGMRKGECGSVAGLMDNLRPLKVTDAIARRARERLRRYRRSHIGINLVLCISTATAEACDVPLPTLDTRHFPMFGDLEPAF